MPRSVRILILLAAASLAVYAYHSNWFVKLDADFSLTPQHVSIVANEMDYHDCKVKLSWEFSTSVSWIPQGERYFINVHEFRQWNGVALESVKALEREVKVSLWCDEGRISKDIENKYSR